MTTLRARRAPAMFYRMQVAASALFHFRTARASWPAGLVLFSAMLAVACGPTIRPVPVDPEIKAVVTVEGNLELADPPADPVIKTLTSFDIEASLRRVTVRVSTWTSLVRTDPKPLFSDAQAAQFSKIIAKELPTLRPDERIRLLFKDQYKKYKVDLYVYGEGSDLVYRFEALIGPQESHSTPNESVLGHGYLEQLPGQTVTTGATVQVLRHPAKREVLAQMRTRDSIRNGIAAALKEERITAEEHDKLINTANRLTNPSEEPWKVFWDKWNLLRKARDQDLITKPAYVERKQSLMQQLSPR